MYSIDKRLRYLLPVFQKVKGAKEELRDAANMLAGLVNIIQSHKNGRVGLNESGSRLNERIDQISQ